MAQWMTGETYLHQKRYIVAIKAYEALISDTNYPSGIGKPATNWQVLRVALESGTGQDVLRPRRQTLFRDRVRA